MSNNKINIWINGAMGKMGTQLISFIKNHENILITGIISPSHAGQNVEVQNNKIKVAKDLVTLSETIELPDVIVDFTKADAGFEAAKFAAKNNIAFVSGTTGFTDGQKLEIDKAFSASSAKAIIAPNFSLGVVLMMEFSAKAAQFFADIEIVETHHKTKLDSPSGTAITTASMIKKSRRTAGAEEIEIPMHSLRLSGAVAHQKVYLSSPGEVFRIEHDANDRVCFMSGVVLSIEKVGSLKNVLYSIAPLIFEE